jgi:hypothetical protein
VHTTHDPAIPDIEVVVFEKKYLMTPSVALVHQKQGGFGVRIDIIQGVPQKSNFHYNPPLAVVLLKKQDGLDIQFHNQTLPPVSAIFSGTHQSCHS